MPPVEGQQSAVAGGGRYDGLIEELGGNPTPGIGFGMGIERVLIDLKRQKVVAPEPRGTKVLLAHMDEKSKEAGLALCSRLRLGGVAAVLGPTGRSLKSQLRCASAIDATHAVIIGERELSEGTVVLRDLARSEQQTVDPDELLKLLAPR